MKRLVLLGWLIALAGGAIPPGFGAPSPAAEQSPAERRAAETRRPASPLKDVKELDKPVTLSETKIALGELVRKVSEETGVPITAAAEVADEPVAVVVNQLPARELLEQVAALLDYTWSRRGRSAEARGEEAPAKNSGPGGWRYEIWQDLASKRREEALRQAVFAAAEKRFRRELARYVEMAALSQEQIDQILSAARQRRQELQNATPEQRQALARSAEEQERRQAIGVAARLRSPVPRAMATLLGRLSAQQWSLLAEKGQLSFSTGPLPGDLPLPGEVARTLRSSRPQSRFAFGNPGTQERMRRLEQEVQDRWSSATGYRIIISLDIQELKTRGSPVLQARAIPIRGGAPAQPLLVGAGMDTTLSVSTGPVRLQQQEAENTPERRAELEKDPVLGGSQRFTAAAKPRIDADAAIGPTWRLQQLLPDLARTYGVQIISDAYWDSPSVTLNQVYTPEPTPLFALLDRFTGRAHRWDRHENLIRLRSRTWFFDRQREVPLRLVQRWKQMEQAHTALSLEEYVGVAAVLNDGQWETLQELADQGVLPQDFADLGPARAALRLYGSLAPAQQQALWQGQAVPVARMTSAQRRLFLAAMEEESPFRPAPLDMTILDRGSLSLTTRRLVRVREPNQGSVSDRVEPAAARRDAAGEEGTRFPVAFLEFRLQLGPATHTAILTVAALP